MINKVILVGNVGADPDVKVFSDAKVANFSLATSESYTDKQGAKQTITEWHRIVVWRGLAEVVERYVKKGSSLYIEGKIRTRTYDDANGIKRYATEIIADTIKMLGRATGDSSQEHQAAHTAPVETPTVENYDGNDDLPF